mgnify:CR=1 FL=1
MAKKILIAGGTGFLGFHLTKYFKEKKFKVYVLHKNKINKKKIITNVKYIQVNISRQPPSQCRYPPAAFDTCSSLDDHISRTFAV